MLVVTAAIILAAAVAHEAAAERSTLPRATLATFAGYWYGHTRGLAIRISYRLARPRGTTTDALVRIRVTSVRLYNKAIYWKGKPRPRVGQVGTLRVKKNLVFDSITDTYFCGPRARPGRCGA